MKNGGVVRVHLHLPMTKRQGRPVYSVLGRHKSGWKLLGHRMLVRLKNVSFIVSESARQRVLTSGQRNVHAFVQGTLDSTVRLESSEPVTYSPFAGPSFRRRADDTPIHEAPAAILGRGGVVAGITAQPT